MKGLPFNLQVAYRFVRVNMPFYAVAKGKKVGVYTTWPECQEQVVGFKQPVYKKFITEDEAKKFISERSDNTVDKRIATATPSKEKHSENVSKDSATSSLKRRHSEEDEESSKKSKDSDKSKFTTDDDGFLIVYTDGSCGFNGKHGAKAGVGVYFGEEHPMNVSEPVKGRATNNTAEIQAATYALQLTKSAGFDKVILHTDSQFMINCATSWMPNWKKNDWKKKDGAEVINKEDLIELDESSNGLLVKWNHIKAHVGVPGNEAADKLAKAGAKRYEKEE